MRIVVLGGCGDMGRFVVQDLAEHTDAELVIADLRLHAAERLAEEIGPRARAAFVDATNPESLVQVMQGADAAVGCIGPFYRFGLVMAQAAVEAGVNYVDICDDYSPVTGILALHHAAQAKGITLITGLGWTPGLTNILARKGVDELDRVSTVRIYWAGSAADAQGLAVVMHVFYAVTGEVPSYVDDQWVKVRAGSGRELVDFGPLLGKVEVAHCGHPEPITVPRYLDVRTVTLQGGLTPRWNNRLADILVGLGLSRTPQRIETASKVIHRLQGVIGAGGVPYSGARVDVYGTSGGRAAVRSYRVVDKQGRLTGIPAAIGAAMLASGAVHAHGVFAPEGCIDPEPFLEELAKRRVWVEQVTPA